MKHSKVFTLIQRLPAKQVELLSAQLKLHKRRSLFKLFQIFSEHSTDKEPQTDVVFNFIFEKKYSKDQDYLLRNEYRLLYKWLLENLFEQKAISEAELLLFSLKLFLDLKLYELFEGDLKLAWKKGVEADDTDFLVQLSDLNIRFHLEGKPQSLSNAEDTIAHSLSRINLLELQFLRKVREEEIRLRMNERIISDYKPVSHQYQSLQGVDLSKLEKKDLYAQYLSWRAQVNLAKGAEKINLLSQIPHNEALIHKYEANPNEAICRFWANLAQEYYLNSDFKNAIEYFQKVEPELASLPLLLQETLVLNYALTLMRNEQFEKAQSIAMENSKLLLNSRTLSSRSPFLLAVLHLYARDAQSAEKFVTLENKKEGSEFFFFMRLILSAVYYLRGDIELALRESINIDQAVNYELNREQTLQTQISKPIVSIFRRFYSIIQNSTKHQLKTELNLLSKEITSEPKSYNDQSPNSILTQWILREIKLITSNKS